MLFRGVSLGEEIRVKLSPAARSRSHPPLPGWLKKRLPAKPDNLVSGLIQDLELRTVCQSARCPNQLECWQRGTATFLLMGPNCTRRCGFCAVDKGAPRPLDPEEPGRVAAAVKRLKLRHAVITAVTRDDLPDGGAAHFAATVNSVRELNPRTTVEILTPDFQAQEEHWATAADSLPDVFNHNLETVPRLYPRVRPGAGYQRSLDLLAFVKDRHPGVATKSGLMLGLGEEGEEVIAVARALRRRGVDMITIGQYLRPGPDHLPVERYVTPEEFRELAGKIEALGFAAVAAGPFVRSSYHAAEAFHEARKAAGRGK